MGRSENSRNRIFKLDEGALKTYPRDIEKVKNPELIIYSAMRELDTNFIVSNGIHTDAVYDAFENETRFEDGMFQHDYEPDGPNFTPRIAGALAVTENGPTGILGIIKKSPLNDTSIHSFWHYRAFDAGFGWCLHTYQTDGNPIPNFDGEPYLVPLAGNGDEIVARYWDLLDAENKISIAIKTIDIATGSSDIQIINRY
ncbi:inosine monophosphate cyclohydrolase, partial [bacterium]|nr:inosine monophosphate cyclohydrolase [bacterium]